MSFWPEWSQKLEDAGVKVIFGVEGLKVHSKVLHIGMKRGADLACISTGNFHEGNAKAYTDCIIMTSSRRIVKEVEDVFEFIERPYAQIHFKELLVSPNEMKSRFIALINNEIKNKRNGKPAYIRAKVNHITDPVMVDKLYDAAYAGVDIELSVRGNCSIVTDKLPDNCHLRINGIIDRYLEHSRIFIGRSSVRSDDKAGDETDCGLCPEGCMPGPDGGRYGVQYFVDLCRSS